MFPYKAADTRVLRDRLEATISKLIPCSRTAHAAVINKGLCDVGNLRLKNKGDITVKNWHGVSPAHGQASAPKRAKRRLKRREVAGFDSECAVIEADEKIHD